VSTREAVVAATAGRDRVVDAVKGAALLLVVLGHNMAWTLLPGGTFQNTLDAAPWLAWITWVFEIIPLFFVVAGWGLHRLTGRGADATCSRVARLLGPALPLLLATLVLAWVVPLLFSPELGPTAGVLPVQPLWFVGVYLLVIALAPVILRVRHAWQFAVWLGLIGAVDWLRVSVHPSFGWANMVLVWSLFAAVGANLDRLRRLPRWVPLVGLVGCVAAAVALVLVGPYSAALISTTAVPGITNLAPPTAVLAFAGLAQACVLLLAWDALDRLLARDRVWVPVVLFSSRAMEVYLWHVLLMALLIATLLPLGLAPPAFSPLWWLLHVVVLALDLGVLLLVAPALRRVSTALLDGLGRAVPASLAARTAGGPRLGAAVIAVVLGVSVLLISEGGLQNPLEPRVVAILPYVPLVALVLIFVGTPLAARASRP